MAIYINNIRILLLCLLVSIYANGQMHPAARLLFAQQTPTCTYPTYIDDHQFNAGGTTLTIDYPTTYIQNNDILILHYITPSGTLGSTPTGFTAGASFTSSNLSSAWCWKRTTGSESGSVTISGFGTSCSVGHILVYRGCITTGNPFLETSLNESTSSTTTTVTATLPTSINDCIKTVSLISINNTDVGLTGLTDGGSNTLTTDDGVSANIGCGDYYLGAQSINRSSAISTVDVSDAITSSQYYIAQTFNLIPPGSSTIDLTNGLVACWEFDETSGTTAYDETANNNDGTISGCTLNQTGVTNLTPCFEFGANDYVNVSKGSDFVWSNQSSFSISCWLNSNSLGGRTFVLQASTGKFAVEFRDNNLILNRANQANQVVVPTGVLTGNWYHVVGTYNGTTLTAYVNGSYYAEDDWDYSNVSAADGLLYLGNDSASPTTRYFNGKLDQISVWDRVLSTNEITSLYNSGGGLPYSSW